MLRGGYKGGDNCFWLHGARVNKGPEPWPVAFFELIRGFVVPTSFYVNLRTGVWKRGKNEASATPPLGCLASSEDLALA